MSFRIAAAQIASVRGDVAANLESHRRAIEAAADRGISVLVFPELSLTGYEPDLARELAMDPGDERLSGLRALAASRHVDVVVGAPLRNDGRPPWLGALVLGSDGTVRAYRKMHLGSKEGAFFSAGDAPLLLHVGETSVGIAVCADTSEPSHPRHYAEAGAHVYAAGVFFDAEWYPKDSPRLAEYAARHRMLVVMANHGASTGALRSVGRSAVWAPGGELLARAAGDETCFVVATGDGGGWRGEVLRP